MQCLAVRYGERGRPQNRVASQPQENCRPAGGGIRWNSRPISCSNHRRPSLVAAPGPSVSLKSMGGNAVACRRPLDEPFSCNPDSDPGHSREINETAKRERGGETRRPFPSRRLSEDRRKDIPLKVSPSRLEVSPVSKTQPFIEMKNDRDRKHKTESSQPSVAH